MDDDIQYALQAVRSDREAKRTHDTRTKKVKAQKQLAVDRLETMLEMFGDEVEAYLPRTDAMFLPVLTLVVLRKMQRQIPREPEEVSPLEMWPEGY